MKNLFSWGFVFIFIFLFFVVFFGRDTFELYNLLKQ